MSSEWREEIIDTKKRRLYIPGAVPGRDFIVASIISVFFFSCETPVEPEEETDPVTDITFNYLQEDEKIFTSAKLKDPFNGDNLVFAQLIWYGTNGFNQTTPDSFFLSDNGDFGDILKKDNVYSVKIPIEDLGDTNSILYGDTGIVYLQVLAHYDDNVEAKVDSFDLGNINPKFLWIDAPDTLNLPDSGFARLVDIKAKVTDANGVDDIQWVGFTSRHVEPDTMLNNGNHVYLFDDGKEDHGDTAVGDSVYSILISFPYNAKTGELEWRFRVQDQSNAFRDTSHFVVVLE
ncbi:MAG: hypothetical protein V3U24_11205 [Candidatus Neomarinimicrobiota bacterium]